jgi:hypothetical protein
MFHQEGSGKQRGIGIEWALQFLVCADDVNLPSVNVIIGNKITRCVRY